jgi:hypothetical protein
LSRFVVEGLSKENFSHHIRFFVASYKISYIEALTEVVQANGLEPDDIKSTLSEDIIFQLRQEAISTNMLRRSGSSNKIEFE